MDAPPAVRVRPARQEDAARLVALVNGAYRGVRATARRSASPTGN